MNNNEMKSVCKSHLGHEKEIKNLQEKQKDRNGEFIRLWNCVDELIDNKLSTRTFFIILIIAVGIVGSVTGLMYHTQMQMLHQQYEIKGDVKAINTKIDGVKAVMEERSQSHDIIKIFDKLREKVDKNEIGD